MPPAETAVFQPIERPVRKADCQLGKTRRLVEKATEESPTFYTYEKIYVKRFFRKQSTYEDNRSLPGGHALIAFNQTGFFTYTLLIRVSSYNDDDARRVFAEILNEKWDSPFR